MFSPIKIMNFFSAEHFISFTFPFSLNNMVSQFLVYRMTLCHLHKLYRFESYHRNNMSDDKDGWDS
jgi:hypothetical protein